MTRALSAALLMLLFATGASAQTAALGDVSLTSDADHFHSFRLRAGALIDYKSPFEYTGAAIQSTRYSHSDWHRAAPAVLFLFRRQQRDTLAGTLAEVGLVRVGGRMRIVGDATWSVRPSSRTGFEVVAAADVVETRRALDRGIAYTFVAADVERQLTERLTAIGLAGYQHFNDGNDRVHARARLIWALVPEHGLNAQLRWRHFDSDGMDVDRAYFNPRHYDQWDAGLSMRKRHAGWIWYGAVAAGRESVDASRTTGNVEVRAEGPLPHDMRVVLRASYNRSAGFAITDRYWYGTAGVTLVVPIRF